MFLMMERVLKFLNKNVSSSEVDEKKFMSKVSIWDFANILKEKFQQFTKKEKSCPIQRYFNVMKARFHGELFFCF